MWVLKKIQVSLILVIYWCKSQFHVSMENSTHLEHSPHSSSDALYSLCLLILPEAIFLGTVCVVLSLSIRGSLNLGGSSTLTFLLPSHVYRWSFVRVGTPEVEVAFSWDLRKWVVEGSGGLSVLHSPLQDRGTHFTAEECGCLWARLRPCSGMASDKERAFILAYTASREQPTPNN